MTGNHSDPTPLRKWVNEQSGRLQQEYIKDRSHAVAGLARLRRAVDTPPGVMPDILDLTYAPFMTQGWHSDQPSARETAAHHAMTLFAVHQQSLRKHACVPGWGVGRAARALHPQAEISPTDPAARRFATLVTSTDLDELLIHLRGLVKLLRGAEIPLDYGLLADQLFRWQRFEDAPERIRRDWGRQFHRAPNTESDTTPPSDNEKTEDAS
ncbi:type I-E CRISPR-associated protein Cse2/CasB [Actinoalloteichus caeruleus]|uniref:type I-E CRISPR-associated protein Cse2/CasB n=1 Tax=Actinoalloteichus cyanogriseus TaxID=2893586 RepID=UPI003BB92E65